jgi:hypothetical protein
MKEKKRPVSDDELDALLTGFPVIPAETFAERTFILIPPVEERELDDLLSGQFISVSPGFTERTLTRIENSKSTMLYEIPAMRWLVKSGMAAAILLVGVLSYSVWQNQNPTIVPPQAVQANFAEMNFEELLYLEETLNSAKVLIELEKTVPLYCLMKEADS